MVKGLDLGKLTNKHTTQMSTVDISFDYLGTLKW